MKNLKKKCLFSFLIFMISIFLTFSNVLSSEDEKNTIPISKWLFLGPIKTQLPLFHQDKNPKGEIFKLTNLLTFEAVDFSNWWPKEGESLKWDKKSTLNWEILDASSKQEIFIKSEGKNPEFAFLASYIYATRFMKVKFEASGYHLFEFYLDGEKLFAKTSVDLKKENSDENKPGKKFKDVSLEPGTHILLVKMLKDPNCDFAWNFNGNVQISQSFSKDDLNFGLNPKQKMTIKHLLDGPKVTTVSISPDGELAAISIRESQPPSDQSESWMELRNLETGKISRTFRGGMNVTGVKWAPVGKMFSYTTSSKAGRSLWVVDVDRGETIQLLKDIKNLGNHKWSPDGSFIIYSVTEEANKNETGLKKMRGMTDRWPGWRNRSFLYVVNYPEGTKRRLTGGSLSTDLNDISPDGKKLIFTRSVVDYLKRPYSKTQFYLLGLQSLQLDSLFTVPWSGSAQWSPTGKKLVVTGGPSMFGKKGVNVTNGKIPNDYDSQAYIYDLATKEVESITKEFDPAINQAIWSKNDGHIYLNTSEGSYRNLYRYYVNQKQFEAIKTGVEVLGTFDLANSKSFAVYTGSGTSMPPKAYFIDLQQNKYSLLSDPGANDYKYVEFGKTDRWTFHNKQNVEIEGRIYYPPDFDSQQKYPCIVYYYGGTSPVSRDFGGRYPKEIWAASGYVVYVLQPSGATGFGQDFSALHVNDWGKIVADEIIDGTKQFLTSHPFIDQKKVGCIGASFGGFITMLLQTKTDIFAAAVAHAGISSISSYWGEGFWGYSYSAIATANSFPWNRKDIYINQSPLFHADNVQTPILLLHGNSDTNVPPGESRQFYTALKLLGKEVELIEVDGQDHHILAYNKRKLWTKTIIAWFDRYLKDQLEWWNYLYPENE